MMITNPRINPNFNSPLNTYGITKDLLDLRRENFPFEVVECLKFCRQRCDVSVEEMADYLGMDPTEYRLFEDGKLPLTIDDLCCLCNLLPWDLTIKERRPIKPITELEFVEEKK